MTAPTVLYLFSVQVVSVTRDRWEQQPVLYFVDTEGRRHTYTIRNYVPSLLLRPDNENLEPSDVEDHLRECDPPSSLVRIEESWMTPLVGFTNHRKDRMFRLYYASVGQKSRLVKQLQDLAVTVLHQNFSQELQFLHSTGWTLQSWYTLEGSMSSAPSFVDQGFSGSLRLAQLHPQSTLPMPIPPLSVAYIRLTIKSSTATRANRFVPDHTIDNDRIEVCEVRVGRLDRPGWTRTVLESPTEQVLLQEIRRWFTLESPCILVHMSDPVDHLAYLHFRAKRHGLNPGLSSLRARQCRENQQMSDASFRDLLVPGRETVDLLHVLQKFMIVPNLDGYTLHHAFHHPKLLRAKELLAYQGDEDVSLAPLGVRRAFIQKELDVLCALQSDNAFIVNNLALSASCDLPLFQIISRGQQARAFACFARAYHREGFYINHTQFEKPYLLVKRKQADSTYPDPPWIENPPLDSLRGVAPAASPSRKKRRLSVLELLGKPPPSGPAKPKSDKRFGGGLVIVPSPGFYHRPWEAIVTLDFASLYPSIMKGYRICYMRVCYDPRWLEDPRAEKEYVPLDADTCCVFIRSYDGIPATAITDRIVDDVMQNRKRVRAEMCRTQDLFVKQSLDAQQLCCKILQNAFYGACGSETFGIPCTAIAASVCMIGQWMNKTVRHRAMLLGGRCVYGDTDSVMLQFPTDVSLQTRDEILRDIYRQGHALEAETTRLFPPPNAVEFETLKLPHLQTTKKKTYAAHEYPPGAEGWNRPYVELYKGFAFKKRDRCAFVQSIGKTLMTHLLSNVLTDVDICRWLQKSIEDRYRSRPTENQLGDFIITCRLGTEYKQENVLALQLATQYEKETGTRPRPGCRLQYVIVTFPDQPRKHFESSVTPEAFLRDSHLLDTDYYLGTQLLLPLKQILDLRPTLYDQVDRLIQKQIAEKTRPGRGRLALPALL